MLRLFKLIYIFTNTINLFAITHTVEVGNFYFSPKTLRISSGDKVCWKNKSGNLHNVNFKTNSITGEDFNNNNTPSLDKTSEEDMGCLYFETPQTYNYDCSIGAHAQLGMVGSVIVERKGCTDSNAKNFNQNATKDDGSCVYETFGCTDSNAKNFNQSATKEDSSCEYETLRCSDPEATNYNQPPIQNGRASENNPLCLYGCLLRDTNCNGVVSQEDVRELIRHIILGTYARQEADINQNNKHDIVDVLLIINHLSRQDLSEIPVTLEKIDLQFPENVKYTSFSFQENGNLLISRLSGQIELFRNINGRFFNNPETYLNIRNMEDYQRDCNNDSFLADSVNCMYLNFSSGLLDFLVTKENNQDVLFVVYAKHTSSGENNLQQTLYIDKITNPSDPRGYTSENLLTLPT
ncbi:MAG: hypothetical protein CMP11_03370, partial [Zetaproteobacteria bacterium]|nr:hypothetical protein [Pseudobdellovibrionaceae bacterium]